MSRQETRARVAPPRPHLRLPLFHKRAGTAPGSRCNPPPGWWGKWKRPAPDAHAGIPRRTAAGCPAGFSPAHTAAAGWPPRGLPSTDKPFAKFTPDQGSARNRPYKAPKPSPSATSSSKARVGSSRPARRSSACHPSIFWFICPAFSRSVMRESKSATRSAMAALRHDSYPSCHPFRKQAAAFDSRRLLVEHFILSTPPFPTGA